MHSITKSNLSTETIRHLVELHFPKEQVFSIVEFSEGMCNGAWKITGTGSLQKDVVLKAGPSDQVQMLTYEKDKLRTEILVYQLLSNREIPIPRLLASDTSRREVPCDYFFMDWVPGATWLSCLYQIPAENRPELMRQLGRCFGAIHSVEGGWFGYIKEDTRFQFDTWGAAFTAMMTDILNDGRKHGCLLPYEKIERVLTMHQDRLNVVKTPRLVDFDLWAGNVFLNAPDCTDITGVIDFEQCFFGDPLADFTAAVHLLENVESEQEFLEGYAQIRGSLHFSEDDRIRMDLYRLYMQIILFVEAYRFDEAYAENVRRRSGRKMEVLQEKLTASS